MGKSQLFALRSSYALIAMHLLKQMKQPEKATASWENTINRERGSVVDLFEDNPGLNPKREEAFAKAYRRPDPMRRSRPSWTCDMFPSSRRPPWNSSSRETGGPKVSPRTEEQSEVARDHRASISSIRPVERLAPRTSEAGRTTTVL